MSETTEQERDRESFVRWQEISVTQLGYTINLMLTLAGTALGFAAKTMMEAKVVLPLPARLVFHASVPLLALSFLAAVAANWARCLDFKNTRRAARARVENGAADHDKFRKRADLYGDWTWGLFSVQAFSFAFGVAAFAMSIWCGFGNRI